ncbi:hypothetical protein GGI35DRAFT_493717 [Trichoderma velutinum]
MVGAAQYLDEEIDWVLSAVVGKKKQSYIQTHFKDKFGRSLNHNQIRYIKNKYGKDPRFNSPLVNTRAPRIATSPKPGDPGEQEGEDEQGDDIDFDGPRKDGPSLNIGERQGELKDGAVAMIRAKRKRGADDSGDGRPRFIKKITGPQRPELRRDRASKTVEYETPPQQWNTLDHQLATSSNVLSASTPPTSSGHGYNDTQQTAAHYSIQQPMLSRYQNSGTSIGWTQSVPLSTWENDSPVFTSVNYSMNPPTLTYEQLYPAPAEQTHAFPKQLLLAAPPVSPFPSFTPNVTPHIYQSYQEEPYHQPSFEAPENPDFPNLATSEVQGHLPIDTLSSVSFPLVPSFQEMPIEPASSQGVAELSTLTFAAGDVHEHY